MYISNNSKESTFDRKRVCLDVFPGQAFFFFVVVVVPTSTLIDNHTLHCLLCLCDSFFCPLCSFLFFTALQTRRILVRIVWHTH